MELERIESFEAELKRLVRVLEFIAEQLVILNHNVGPQEYAATTGITVTTNG
jgi:hypothetical protein